MQIEKTIDEASNKGNNSLEEHIPPVFTAACTATKISVLERETLLEVLEETFFLHEFLVVCGLMNATITCVKVQILLTAAKVIAEKA